MKKNVAGGLTKAGGVAAGEHLAAMWEPFEKLAQLPRSKEREFADIFTSLDLTERTLGVLRKFERQKFGLILNSYLASVFDEGLYWSVDKPLVVKPNHVRFKKYATACLRQAEKDKRSRRSRAYGGECAFGLGLYYHRTGETRKALHYLKRGVALGFAECAVFIGTCYEDGDGVEANAYLAVKWYMRATSCDEPDTTGWVWDYEGWPAQPHKGWQDREALEEILKKRTSSERRRILKLVRQSK